MLSFLVFLLALQGAPVAAGSPSQAPPTAAQIAEVYGLFAEGQSLANAGNVSGAIARYKRALDVLPGAAELRAELASAYADQGDTTNAELEASKALETDPSNRTAHRLLGLIVASRVARAGGEDATSFTRRAIAHLEQSQAVALRDPLVMITLGELYLRAEEFARSSAILEQFLVDRPGYPQATMLLAEAYRRAGRTEAARELVSGLEGMVSDAAAAHRREAASLSAQGAWREAAAAWGRVLEDDPRDASARLQYAAALANAGDLAAARGELTVLTRDEPNEIGAWQMLAQVELRAGRLQMAEEAARRIDTINPADSRGPLTLAAVRAEREDYRGVVVILDRRVTSPLSADVASGAFAEMASRLADAWFEVGNNKRALDTLEGARARVPDDLRVLFSLGAAYERTRDFGKAERAFRDVIAADPEHAGALNYLGYMLADRGRKLPEALALIERALVIDPDNAAYLDSLGWAYFKLKRYGDAVTPLEKAAAGAPESSVIQDHLGEAYVKVGRQADAAAAFERALAGDRDGIDPDKVARKRDQARASAGKR